MLSYLAFDSRSIKSLLSENNHQYFSSDFPLFFKNEDGKSAIDVSLGKNQIRSVNLMIDYIIKHQNSYVYSHLFNFNLVELIDKEVIMAPLFNSQIFYHTFDFDEWPATHSNTDKMMAAYNDSMFNIRFQYPAVFKKLWKKDHLKSASSDSSNQKVFKIKYILNFLTSVSDEDGQITEAIANSDELDIF